MVVFGDNPKPCPTKNDWVIKSQAEPPLIRKTRRCWRRSSHCSSFSSQFFGMDDLVKLFEGLKVTELTRRQCLAPDDLNGLATFNLISPGDPISFAFSGGKYGGNVAGTPGNIRLECKTPEGVTLSSSRGARDILVKVLPYSLRQIRDEACLPLLLT